MSAGQESRLSTGLGPAGSSSEGCAGGHCANRPSVAGGIQALRARGATAACALGARAAGGRSPAGSSPCGTCPPTSAEFCWFEAGHGSCSLPGKAFPGGGGLRAHCSARVGQLPSAECWGRVRRRPYPAAWGISRQAARRGGPGAGKEA